MDRFLLSRLLLAWVAISIALLPFVGFGSAIQNARQGTVWVWGEAAVQTAVSPERASKIEEAFKSGICDPVLEGEADLITLDDLEDVCTVLNFQIQLDKGAGIYETPYTYQIFTKNQRYWYERNFETNILATLQLWAILSAVVLLVLSSAFMQLHLPR